jgi:sugar phosphate isomerase/epimerase
MMQLGVFAKTFSRPTLGGVLDAAKSHGLCTLHFDLACAGVPSLPDRIDPRVCDEIRAELAARELTMASVSGTYNMAHPDAHERARGLQRLRTLASACERLGTSVITLCTGTRDPHNKWRYHPDNATPAAWRDLQTSMEAALGIADEYHVTLGMEPEVSNIVDSAHKARRLMAEMKSDRLKIVIDAANLFPTGTLSRQREILDEAFDLLGQDIIVAHAKDLDRDGQAGQLAAGFGLLDYDHYISLLQGVGFVGPLILHGLAEDQVNRSMRFLQAKL